MSQQITNEQEFDLSVEFKTAAGNPATVVGVPTWAIADALVATLNVRPDGRSAVVTSGMPGATVITVTAVTASGASIVGEFDVLVVLAEAGEIIFTVSNIRLKPVVSTGTEAAKSLVSVAGGSVTEIA